MDISFVILTCNSASTIEKCLESIITSMTSLNKTYEVLIVDNGSSDNTTKYLEQYQANNTGTIDVTFLEHNEGTTRSRNRALRKATGEQIVVMDSDTYINPEAIHTLSKHVKENPQCGVVVPAITYADGRHQMSVDQFPTLIRKIARLLFLKRLEEASREKPHSSGRVDYAISAFWMMPASTLKKVGLLDERIFYSPEDVDYCIRVWRSGLSVEQNIEAAVVHDAQEISRPASILGINSFTLSHIFGMFYLFRKHKFMFRPPRTSMT